MPVAAAVWLAAAAAAGMGMNVALVAVYGPIPVPAALPAARPALPAELRLEAAVLFAGSMMEKWP